MSTLDILCFKDTGNKKTGLKVWTELPQQDRTWNNFKKYLRDVQIVLRKTGDLTIDEGLNHTKIINMVSEGLRVAFDKHTPAKQVNNMAETDNLCAQLNEMRELIERVNNA